MNKIFLIVLLNYFCFSFSQEIKSITEYAYERHFKDSISYDTIIKSIKTYDQSGTLFSHKEFDKSGDVKSVRIFVSENLEIVYLGEPNRDSTGGIEYHYDEFHNVIMITPVSNIDTMKYSTLYSDSLILKRECIRGCNYSNIYEYDSLGRLSIVQEVFPNRTYFQYYEYDNSNRLIKWTSELGSTIIATNYSPDDLTITEKYCAIKDSSDCWNITITWLNTEGQVASKEFYMDNKLSYKSYFTYSMW